MAVKPEAHPLQAVPASGVPPMEPPAQADLASNSPSWGPLPWVAVAEVAFYSAQSSAHCFSAAEPLIRLAWLMEMQLAVAVATSAEPPLEQHHDLGVHLRSAVGSEVAS